MSDLIFALNKIIIHLSYPEACLEIWAQRCLNNLGTQYANERLFWTQINHFISSVASRLSLVVEQIITDED